MHQFSDQGRMHQLPDAKKSHWKGMRGLDVVPVFRAPRVGDGRVHQFSDETRMHKFPDAKKLHGKGMRGLDLVPVFRASRVGNRRVHQFPDAKNRMGRGHTS